MRYYISDLHFYHESLLHRMDNRGFESVEAMHEYIISKWNHKVRPNDEVVILGDFSIGKGAQTNSILEKLNGRKMLIQGNHDKFLECRRFDKGYFEWIEAYKELNDNNRKVVLCHYPVFCYNGQYRTDAQGQPKSYMLYGHVHDTYDEFLINDFQNQTRLHKRMVHGTDEPVSIPCNMINCFCMFSDYEPLSLDEWIEVDKLRRQHTKENRRITNESVDEGI